MNRTIAGTMKWGAWGANHSTKEMVNLIAGCVDNGLNTFDHADIYGGYTTESEWGKAWNNLKIDREEIKIISKCGICYPCAERPQYQIKHYNASSKHIIESTKKSISNLKCDYLDVLLFHRPSPLMHAEEIAEAIGSLKEAGLIRSFGVSNFEIAQMELLRRFLPLDVIQLEISFLHMDPLHNGILDYCMQHNIEVQAWSPIGGGKIFEKSADYKFVNQRARLKSVADKYGWNLDEMAYLFLFHHPLKIRPVVGSSRLERIIKVKELEAKKISDDQWFEIWTASSGSKVP